MLSNNTSCPTAKGSTSPLPCHTCSGRSSATTDRCSTTCSAVPPAPCSGTRALGIEVGIFCALHTYGRQLNQHPPIHVSVTRGGLDVMHGVWHRLFFKKKAVEEIWQSAVIRLLRDSYAQIMPGMLPGLGHIRDERQWRRYLQAQYGRYWKVHFAKKTRGAWHSVNTSAATCLSTPWRR
ncbi:hypothetical protein EWM60_16150 [Candidatus Erwinia dacicola]|nr:hypothetical protein [Candidatus Erwinia dacicola]